MTVTETKMMIKAEFIKTYYEWLKDLKEMSDKDYGFKYGWAKSQKEFKDNQQTMLTFTKYIFNAFRTDKQWEEAGYEKQIIWQLTREGFLSETSRKWKTFRYISQATAKQIYKEMKGMEVK